jgi:hypothetical protein
MADNPTIQLVVLHPLDDRDAVPIFMAEGCDRPLRRTDRNLAARLGLRRACAP